MHAWTRVTTLRVGCSNFLVDFTSQLSKINISDPYSVTRILSKITSINNNLNRRLKTLSTYRRTVRLKVY